MYPFHLEELHHDHAEMETRDSRCIDLIRGNDAFGHYFR
jgi:hypothetical protein